MIQIFAFPPIQWMSLHRHPKFVARGLGVCVVYVLSFIVDEGARVGRSPYKMEGQFIPARLHFTHFGDSDAILGVKSSRTRRF